MDRIYEALHTFQHPSTVCANPSKQPHGHSSMVLDSKDENLGMICHPFQSKLLISL